jgi:hypothetical protein
MTGAPPADFGNPQAVSDALLDARTEPGGAILGVLFDHLLQYSQNATSVEIKILKDAAALYRHALKILSQIGDARSSMEAGMTTPAAPGVLAAHNAACRTCRT